MREELSEATFRPSINTRNEYEGHGQSVADRNRAWNENKLKKIEALKLQSEAGTEWRPPGVHIQAEDQ